MDDLDFYAWREPVSGPDGRRLLVPLSDPQLHEIAADGIFTSVDEAYDYLELFGWEETAADGGWVLVHYRGEVVGDAQPSEV